jgi:predicted secreted protein
MAKTAGRLAVLSLDGTPVASFKTLAIKWGAESIDVTDSDSAGIIEVLSVAATQQVSITIEGVYKTPTLREIAFDPSVSKLLTPVTIKFADALAAKDTITGSFWMSSYEETNAHDDATEFSCELASSGIWTLD